MHAAHPCVVQLPPPRTVVVVVVGIQNFLEWKEGIKGGGRIYVWPQRKRHPPHCVEVHHIHSTSQELYIISNCIKTFGDNSSASLENISTNQICLNYCINSLNYTFEYGLLLTTQQLKVIKYKKGCRRTRKFSRYLFRDNHLIPLNAYHLGVRLTLNVHLNKGFL